MTCTGVPAAGRRDFWTRALRGWDIGFYVLTAVTGLSIAANLREPGAIAAAWAALAALVVAYLLLGRPGAVRGDLRLTRAYLVVLILVVVAEVWLSDVGPAMLFIAYSQIWFFATSRLDGVVWTLALSAVFGVVIGVQVAHDDGDLASALGQVFAGAVFSIALGLWITWVSEQSEERQALVEQLEAAQAELAATHHTAGMLAERARLAQEIHDTLAQGFTSIVMLAQATSAELDREPRAEGTAATGRAGARDRVAQMEQVARENLAEARALVAAFQPPELERGSLAQALERLATRFRAETGVRVEVVGLDSLGTVSPEAAVVLLRTAQEALANVRKHAGARRVVVTVSGDGREVGLEVVDDGRGLPADVVEGVGLRGMRQRADTGGGSLEVGAAPGGGTRVRLTIPTNTQEEP